MEEYGAGVAAGQLRRQIKLGSAAVYRIRAVEGAYVQVEVVRAPGLRAGQRFKFTRAAVELMELIDDLETEPEPEPGALEAGAPNSSRLAPGLTTRAHT